MRRLPLVAPAALVAGRQVAQVVAGEHVSHNLTPHRPERLRRAPER